MNIKFVKNLVLLAASEFGWTARLLSRSIRPEESSSASWREQYTRGDWDRLWAVSELGRHSVIAGYFAHFAPDGAILEIGCGEGALQQKLLPHGYRRYLGIDVAPEAIRKAQRFAAPGRRSRLPMRPPTCPARRSTRLFSTRCFIISETRWH